MKYAKILAVLGALALVGAGSATILGVFGTISGSAQVAPSIQISEIRYDAVDEDGEEFIEVRNNASTAINVSKWSIREGDADNSLGIVSGDGVVEPGEYALIVENDTFTSSKYEVLNVGAFSLPNSEGQNISVVYTDGNVLDSHNYTAKCGTEGNSLQASPYYFNRTFECGSPTPGGGS